MHRGRFVRILFTGLGLLLAAPAVYAQCTYTITPYAVKSSSGGTGAYAYVTTGSTCAWTITNYSPAWLTITSGGSGTGSGYVYYSWIANVTSSGRIGTIAVTGTTATHTVYQSGTGCTVSAAVYVPPTAAAGSGSVRFISSPVDCAAWTASSGESWLTTGTPTVGLGSAIVPFNVTQNVWNSIRTANFTVGGVSVPITQPAGSSCMASPITMLVPVTMPFTLADCHGQWRPNSYAKQFWFTANAGDRIAVEMVDPTQALDTYVYLLGPDGTKVTYDDDSNGTLNSRIPDNSGGGFYTLPAGGTYRIEATTYSSNTTGSFRLQLAPGCDAMLPITAGGVWSTAGASTTAVVTYAPSNCTWSANSYVSWLTVSSYPYGTGPGVVQITADISSTMNSRTGRVVIGGLPYTVTQMGSGAMVIFTPAADLALAGAGTATTAVSYTPSGTWSATGNQPWLYQYSSNPTSLTYGFYTNHGPTRTGSMLIGNNAFTLTQWGRGDLNKDGMPDAVWQNDSTRQVTVNYRGANGTSLTGWNWLYSSLMTGWRIVGLGDFNGDGWTDVVWQNDTTRQVTVNYLGGGADGTGITGWAWLNSSGIPGWRVVAIADVNRDNKLDLIWQNDTTRQVTVNFYGGSNGSIFQGWAPLSSGIPGWRVACVSDFNRDGAPDLVWQNDSTRQVTVNFLGGLDGTTLLGWDWLYSSPMTGWTVAGCTDFNRDGVSDVVWQNDTTRQVTVNYFGGAYGSTLIGWGWLYSSGIPGWRIIVQ